MLNIRSLGVEPYKFADGEKEVTCNNPSQSFWEDIKSNTKRDFSFFDTVLETMLHEEDKHYIKELEMPVKVALVKDYITYHTKMLEGSFSSTNS